MIRAFVGLITLAAGIVQGGACHAALTYTLELDQSSYTGVLPGSTVTSGIYLVERATGGDANLLNSALSASFNINVAGDAAFNGAAANSAFTFQNTTSFTPPTDTQVTFTHFSFSPVPATSPSAGVRRIDVGSISILAPNEFNDTSTISFTDLNAGDQFRVNLGGTDTVIDSLVFASTPTITFATAVPEPSSMAFLGLAVAGFGARRWKNRRRASV